jgi:hypothetical protein
MAGTYSIILSEAQGYVASPQDIDKIALVMGVSSTGNGLTAFYYSGAAAQAAVGYGDAADTLCQIIEQRQSNGQRGVKVPACFYGMDGSTAGSYGAIDNSGVAGTALFAVDAAVAPYGTYEARVYVITGFTVGVTGGEIQWSLDGGRTRSNTVAVGTADSYTIPNSNTKFVFTPGSTDLTALNTLINEEKTDLAAHVVLTTGTVHSNADNNASVIAMNATASATTTATRIARVNAIKAAYNAHRVLGSGASPAIHINVGGDTTNIVTAADATDDETALTLALEIKTKLNAHDANTTAHTIADATNTVTSSAPAAGAFTAGDVGAVRTFAPACTTADIDAAFADLVVNPVNVGLIILDFPMTAALAAHVSSGVDDLNDIGIRPTVLCRTRIPNFESSETDAAWVTSVGTDFASFNDSRIIARAGYGLITDAMTTRQYRRSTFAQFAADVVRVPRKVWPSAPADQAEANVILVDSTGATVGHDEGPRGASTGLSNDSLGNRFACEQRIPDFSAMEAVYNTVPWTLAASTDRVKNLMVRRVVNAMERTAISAAKSGLGGTIEYNLADPNVPASQPTLTEVSRNAIHAVVYGALATDFATDIQNADNADIDTGLVQVASIITVSGGNLVGVSVTIAPKVLGYLVTESFTLAVQE